MTTERLRVHAFSDDALGEHDAVGLVEEIRAGRVSRREVVQAAVERTLRLADDVVRHKLVQRIVEAYKLHAEETGTQRSR